MKKIALSSLVALFAISSANAATNYFVGGSTDINLDNDHATAFNIAPEFGWKLDSNWDLGLYGNFGYDHKYLSDTYGADGETYSYGAGVFTRYKVAQLGGVKLLLKGSVGADFTTYDPEDSDVDAETTTSINASIIPMITYDLTPSFTLYAELNFLGANAGYTFENEDLGIKDGWNVTAFADSSNVWQNKSDFKIGFNYNF